MASGRTPLEHRAVAEFVTGKSFSQALDSTPSPQAMCSATTDFSNPLAGPQWNGWGGVGFTAVQVPRLKLKLAFGFPGELPANAQPAMAGGRVFVGTQSGTVYSLSAATGASTGSFKPPRNILSETARNRHVPTRSGPAAGPGRPATRRS